MILLDVLSAGSLGWLFVLLLMNIAGNAEQTIEKVNNSLIDVKITPDIRRHRLMMMAFAVALPMLTALLHVVLALQKIQFITLQ